MAYMDVAPVGQENGRTVVILKRTALACALVFLSLNGFEVHVPAPELYALTMSAATGEVDDQVVAAYFRDRVRRKGA